VLNHNINGVNLSTRTFELEILAGITAVNALAGEIFRLARWSKYDNWAISSLLLQKLRDCFGTAFEVNESCDLNYNISQNFYRAIHRSQDYYTAARQPTTGWLRAALWLSSTTF
jgi:hypothetical protein